MIRRQEEMEKFLANSEFADAELQPLAGDASARRYVRVSKNGKKAMVMDTPPEGENFPAFVAISEYLHNNGYSAPQILARDMRAGFLLLEDFGDDSFTRILKYDEWPSYCPFCGSKELATRHTAFVCSKCSAHFSNEFYGTYPPDKSLIKETELYSVAIDLLAEWHDKPTLTLPLYNEELYLREVSLFPDWYLPKIIGREKAESLREEYMNIWREILRSFPIEQNIFVHRDFHADNLMWLSDRVGTKQVGLLDFQDAVIGDAAYDMVSLLEDARRDVTPALVDAMIKRYITQTGTDAEKFYTAYNILGAQRNSKIIGIFMRLALRDGKENYLNYLPRVWAHLHRDLSHPLLKKLHDWLEKHDIR